MIMADQLRADHVGFGGLALGHTPNLDRLAASGSVFERAYAANPVCMPSRATVATGRWPSVHGTRTNGIPLDSNATTVAGSLRRAGWTTAAVGKLHYQPMGWPFEPFQLDDINATNRGAIDPKLADARIEHQQVFDWEYSSRHRERFVAMPDDYYGFGSVDLVVGHGDRASGHYVQWLRHHGVEPDDLVGRGRAVTRSDLWDEVWQTQLPAHLSTSAYVAERAVARVRAATADPAPTFLFVSFPDPHHPFCPPGEYSSIFDPAEIELPTTFDQSPDRLPPHLKHMLERRGEPHADPTFAFAATEAQYREALVAQVGLLAMLDDAVGAILSAVEDQGLADNTVVMFTADHGDLFGDHGLMLKHYVHYDAVTRVPLVIAGDGWSDSSAALVSNADIAATVLDLAEVGAFRGMQGHSLVPLRDDPSLPHRDAVLIEEDQPSGIDGLPGPVRIRTLVTDEARLTLYHDQPFAELYDHRTDRHETLNLAGEPASAGLEARMRARLLHEVLSLADEGRRIHNGA